MLANIIKKLNAEIAKIEKKTASGLAAAGLVIRRDAQEHVPVDLTNLKASAYTDNFTTPSGPVTEIGFTAEYAPWVHEMPGKLAGEPRANGRGQYWDPQGKAEPQFLRNALIRQEKKILELISK